MSSVDPEDWQNQYISIDKRQAEWAAESQQINHNKKRGLRLRILLYGGTALIIAALITAANLEIIPAIMGMIVLCCALGLYFLPSLVASFREHPNAIPIFVLNLLLGWLFVPWVIALVWAFFAIQPNDKN